MPGFGGTQRLARRVGLGAARELVYTGAIIDAAHALRIGLANQVVPHDELLAKVGEVAATIASKAPLAVAASKRVMARGYDARPGDGQRARGHSLQLRSSAATTSARAPAPSSRSAKPRSRDAEGLREHQRAFSNLECDIPRR